MRISIIAEAAQGYEGHVPIAQLLVRAASEAGADIVKFQLVVAEEVATPDYKYYDLFKQLEMPRTAWATVAEEAEKQGIRLAFDLCGPTSFRTAMEVGARMVKIHATDFFNNAFVDSVLSEAEEVLLSVGGIEMSEIEAFFVRQARYMDKVTLLYGFQAEPTAVGDNHLSRLGVFRERFPNLRLGFMDHVDGGTDEAGWLGVLVVPFGVSAIEKHISLDRSLKLEDYISALEPAGFARYVSRIRSAEAALGNPNVKLRGPERNYRRTVLKVVISNRAIASGADIGVNDVRLLRAPLRAGGRPFEQLDSVVGKRARHDLASDVPVYHDDIE